MLLSLHAFPQAVESDEKVDKEGTNYYKRAHLGMSFGFSIPMGSFSANSSEIDNSAFAENGSSFNVLEFGYRIKQNFYAGGSYLLLQNKVDEGGLADALQAQTGKSYFIDATNYELKALMLGVGVSKRSNSLDLDLRFMLGYGNAFIPSFSITETDPQSGEVSKANLRADNEGGLGGGLSLGLRIHINEYLDFNTNASYLIFQKTFEQVNLDNKSASTANISYETLSLTFGLAFRFIDDTPPK